jgi:hypothetical protein
LSKTEAELQAWRDALREALGPNGLLIVDLIPELELVIGKQPPVHDLSPQDAQRRFQAVLRRFISVLLVRSTRWRSSLTICNGSMRPRSICSKIFYRNGISAICC